VWEWDEDFISRRCVGDLRCALFRVRVDVIGVLVSHVIVRLASRYHRSNHDFLTVMSRQYYTWTCVLKDNYVASFRH
jgi:hypothetical protein